MIIIFDLNRRLDYLESLNKEEVWYIVKQELEFWKVCYAVHILELYKKDETIEVSLEEYFAFKADEIKDEKGFENFIRTHRMLRTGYWYGLIHAAHFYKDAELTEVFYKIKEKCGGNFENTDLYYDIIEQQIEKLYISSYLDEKYKDERKNYDLFPIYTLYKIIIEIGNITGKYKITLPEFYTFVCTTEKYEDYLNTVYYILKNRENESERFKVINTILSDDNRLKQVIDNLKIFNISNEIKISKKYINIIKNKIYRYEKNNFEHLKKNSMTKLYKNESLIPEENIKESYNKMSNIDITSIPDNKNINKDIPKNMIIYGAPGTGKSWLLEEKYRKKYFSHDYLYTRVTFNDNFTYTNFVGTFKPTPIYEKISEERELYNSDRSSRNQDQLIPHIDYNFSPGKFLEMLVKAYNDPEHNYLLIIEELNRANVAAVFGDIFQLLDRDESGKSEYPIDLSQDAMDYIISRVGKEKIDRKIYIPDNLYIWATMNNADQNVTKLDTAFKRRWKFKHININYNQDVVNDWYLNLTFLSKPIKWNYFRNIINDYCLKELEMHEDRLIGTFFINDISNEISDGRKMLEERSFKYKLLMYLRDDLFRYNPKEIFLSSYSLGELIKRYEKGEQIFADNIHKKLESEIVNGNDD